MPQVIVDNETIELEQGTVIAVTRQVNDIAEMQNRQADYSARIRAVLTARNSSIFGYTDHPNSTQDKAYQTPVGKIRGSGGPIIEDGVARVLNVTDAIEFMINGPGFTFWNDISGLTLHDIDWADLDFEYTLANIVAYAPNTSGFVPSVVDYYGYADIGGNLDIRYTPLSVFFHECVTRIASAQGYTVAGDVLSDDFYLSLALPFSGDKWQHSDRYAEERSVDKSLYQSQSFADFSNVSVNNKTAAQVAFDGGNAFTAIDTTTLDLSVSYNVSSFAKNAGTGNSISIKLVIRKNGAVQASQVIGQAGANTFAASIPVVAGDVIDMYVLADYTVTSGIANYQIIIDSLNFYTDDIDRTIDLGETLTAESVLPKMNQKTFLKGFMNMFGLVPVIDASSKTLTFRYFDELYTNQANAVDYSDKVVKPSGQKNWYTSKNTRLGKYGQINYFRFAPDDTLDDPNYGRGSITVNDDSLEKEYTAVELPFAASESVTVNVSNVRISRIPLFTDDGAGGYEQTESPTQRIIYIQRDVLAISYSDGSTTTPVSSDDVPWGNFINPANTQNLGFNNNLLSRYWAWLVKMLDQSKRFGVLMNLTATDVANFDFFTPIYIKQLGGLFYVNKISNFVEGKLTSVPVVRL